MAGHEAHGFRAKPTSAFFTCRRHKKLTYPKRREAREAARRLHDKGVREYPCTEHPPCWHIGHIPPMVVRGELTADEWYDLPRREQARRWRLEDEKKPPPVVDEGS